MAREKKEYGVADGFDFNTQEVQYEQEVQHVQEKHLEIGRTQGKKGMKLKRINMAFSDENHEYITKESRRRGISATAFVNQIIELYKNK